MAEHDSEVFGVARDFRDSFLFADVVGDGVEIEDFVPWILGPGGPREPGNRDDA